MKVEAASGRRRRRGRKEKWTLVRMTAVGKKARRTNDGSKDNTGGKASERRSETGGGQPCGWRKQGPNRQQESLTTEDARVEVGEDPGPDH